ncbi:MAG: hypothetical protein EAZ34_07235 [Polaromonas sp.]|nr:MAG: hypothetical protein EAZ34_07235 [Polaromonas sp.]
MNVNVDCLAARFVGDSMLVIVKKNDRSFLSLFICLSAHLPVFNNFTKSLGGACLMHEIFQGLGALTPGVPC